MFDLRGYQNPLVRETITHMNEGGAPCLVSPTGSGKTVMMAEIARLYREWGYQVVLAAHRNEIIKQLAKSCRSHCNESVGFYTAKRATEDKGIMVTMMPTLARRRDAISTFRGRVLLLDECFPAGTLVDGRPIENVCVGDYVTAWDGQRMQQRKVTGLHRNPAPPLMVRLRTTAGTEINCTAGHPVWADGDWRPAIALEPGMAMMQLTTTPTKENSFSAVTWLESVEILEQSSDGKSSGLCPDGFVYNLEVEEDHCYFANGILVHNCHHIQAKTYQEIIRAMQPVFFAGASATPITPTGAGLGKFGITKLILGPQPKQLMDEGSLCKYRMFGGDTAVVDTEGVTIRGGDFKKEEIEERIVNVQGDFLRDLLHFNPDLQPTITVTVSVEHAHKIAAEYNAQGVSAEVIIGTTSERDRDYAFERFTAGKLQVIVSVALIDEGLDLPAATCLQLIRPTRSLRLWKQLIGRVLRTDPSNPDKIALIIDHGNCWERLPLPHEPIDWTLEGKVKFKKTKFHLNENKEVVEKPEKQERVTLAKGDRRELKELSIEEIYAERIKKRVKGANRNLHLVERKGWSPVILNAFASSPEGLSNNQRRRIERALSLPYGHCGEAELCY